LSGQSEGKFQCALQQAAHTYQDAARHFKLAVSELHAGSEEGMAAAKAVTNKLAHVLFDDDVAGSIVGLLDSPMMAERDILHALNVSVLAMMVGQQFALSVEDIKILGIGALLHDIGEQQLPRDLRARRGRFSPEEERMYREHPSLGVQLLSTLSTFPQEALRMIESHHERIDGSGYPDQLQEEYLSLFTKIVMVIDEYDLLINHENPQERMTPADALSYLYRTARATLAPDVIAALVQTLTVYPPGTIVELVTGAYALVLSINRQARMRPLVLLYVPHAKDTAPVIVDLMRDRSRSIAHRPPLSGVPPRIRAYLNMQRWMPYFLAAAGKEPPLPH
jgi:putative nucleotidyltransferase with HDIG domain